MSQRVNKTILEESEEKSTFTSRICGSSNDRGDVPFIYSFFLGEEKPPLRQSGYHYIKYNMQIK